MDPTNSQADTTPSTPSDNSGWEPVLNDRVAATTAASAPQPQSPEAKNIMSGDSSGWEPAGDVEKARSQQSNAAVGDLVRHEASKLGYGVLGGFREMYDLATGKGLANSENRYNQFVQQNASPAQSKMAQDLINRYDKVAGSGANPIQWPADVYDFAAHQALASPMSPMTWPDTVQRAWANAHGRQYMNQYNGDAAAALGSGLAQFGTGLMGLKGAQPTAGAPSLKDIDSATNLLDRSLKDDHSSLAQGAARIKQSNLEGVPERLSEIGPNTFRRADVLAQRPGEASDIIAKDREKIHGDTELRVAQHVKDALGTSGQDYGTAESILKGARTANARANYEAVRNDSTPILDPEIEDILKNPRVAKLYQQAEGANNEARSLFTTAGIPSPPRAEIYAPMAAQAPRPGVESNTILPPPAGEPQWQRTGTAPDVRSLDNLQRLMNSDVTSQFDKAAAGAGGAGDIAKGMKIVRQKLVDRLQALSPTFKAAYDTYGDDSAILRAHELGNSGDFLKMTGGQAKAEMAGMSEAEKQALRMGVTRNLLQNAQHSGNNVNLAQRVLGGSETQNALRQLFDTQESFDKFVSLLERESPVFKNAGKLMGGSPTFARAAAQADFESKLPERIGTLGSLASLYHHGWLGSAGHAALHLLNPKTWHEGRATQAARILSSSDPMATITQLRQQARAALPGAGQATGAMTMPLSASQEQPADKAARLNAQYAKGGHAKVDVVMHEWGQGKLHSGSKKGPVVKSQRQAVAIALSEQRKANRA